MTTAATTIEPEILGPDEGPASEDADRETRRIRRRFWPTVKKAAAQIPFMEDVVAAYFCAFDPQTPARVRLTLFGALAYFVLPVDAIPDILAGIGFSDDAGVLMAAITMVGSNIRDVHRDAARNALGTSTEPKDAPAAQS